jgi:hypothetical protein
VSLISRRNTARRPLVAVVVAGLAAITGSAAAAVGTGRATEAGTLALHAALKMTSEHSSDCPPGTPPSVECHDRSGTGVVRGLGNVTESYTFLVDVNPPGCAPTTLHVVGYPARLVVAGKGEIDVRVDGRPECFSSGESLQASQPFTVTGGSGAFAGASGSGTLHHDAQSTPAAVIGTDTWEGTLVVPGFAFDLTPPKLSGAVAKTVRLPRKAKRVRVTYKVTATDDVDGHVPVSCRPRSGSRFRLGRTLVRCSTRDTSGNTASAKFGVTVKRRG